jgi:polyhydroxybutyrate depolymerase
MRRRSRWHGATVVALVAVVLGSCSGDGKSTKSTTTTNARPTAPERVAARPSIGCSGATPVGPGEEKVTIDSAGTSRWFYRHVPPGYDAKRPTPLVLDIHGYSEGAAVHTKMSALGPYGDQHGFITITPQGRGTIPLWDTNLNGEDMAFIGALLDSLDRTLCVDDNRVYVTGLSNGAFMTSAVACAYADRVAAAAPVAGIREIDGCRPSRAVPVVAFHGTDDGFVAFDGGLGARALSLPAPDGSGRTIGQQGTASNLAKGPSIPDITASWAKRNGCGTPPQEQAIASDVTVVRFSCPPGAEAELYRITGGGHTWPGSQFSKAISSFVGPTTFSISANEVMWSFFSAHPRRAA